MENTAAPTALRGQFGSLAKQTAHVRPLLTEVARSEFDAGKLLLSRH